jgi:hypothetical protein
MPTLAMPEMIGGEDAKIGAPRAPRISLLVEVPTE